MSASLMPMAMVSEVYGSGVTPNVRLLDANGNAFLIGSGFPKQGNLTFLWTSQLKHALLRAFLAGSLPKRLSKVGVLAGRSKKKSKKTLHRSVTFHKISEKC